MKDIANLRFRNDVDQWIEHLNRLYLPKQMLTADENMVNIYKRL